MIENGKTIKVGIADMKIAKAPDKLRTAGLGSCVGIILYDLHKKTAGMAHIMLPDSTLARGKTIHMAKYADTAVETLIRKLEEVGVRKVTLRAKIAGGAQMFQTASKSEIMRIGPRNVEAVKKQLEKYRIPIIAEDTGGSNGRTIEFNPENGVLTIRTVNLGIKEI
ncbi:chemotaxis protein CheD [Fervidibacillus halotolerans]|uniref:Probable chemoreceptor glutamine deamidase CheD n=1 Tax=Fervidibacillus halotolerans TaxID=2980027 RepID=A0A9E8M1Q6_9BACI|nr:chemotaxis protein CheD [Fervidibacillus halotolerans]WAA13581.1 chemotaxis protein CheD [Fervidibacillus halotolerans]